MAQRPFELVLHLTHCCNMRCRYCYGGEPAGPDMTLDVARRGLRMGQDLAKRFPSLFVAFFGGEPLLRFDLIQRVVEDAEAADEPAAQGLEFGLTTNGVLLDDEKAAWLAAYRFDVVVSIDGGPDAHNRQRVFPGGRPSYPAVLAGIRAAQRQWIEVRAALTITPPTAGQLVDGLDHLRGLGIRDVEVTPDYDRSDWTPRARETLRGQMLQAADYYADHFSEMAISFLDEKVCARADPNGAYPCGFGSAKLAVSAGGNLYGCERMIHDDRDATYRVGTVRDGLDVAKLSRFSRRASRAQRSVECVS